jgi:hypothetical protein
MLRFARLFVQTICTAICTLQACAKQYNTHICNQFGHSAAICTSGLALS